MRYYVGIEELAANALIECLSANGSSQVSFSELHTYGETVVKIMEQNGCRAVLVLSRDRTNAFIYDCSDYFKIVDNEIIELRSGKTVEDLRKAFRSETPFQVLKACIDPRSLEALGLSA